MSKFNVKQATEAGVVTAATLGGSMLSRVAADKIPLKNKMLKHGGLALAGIVLAALSSNKTTSAKALQGAGVGIAATQLNEVVKEALKPKDNKPMEDGILKTAVGMSSPNVVVVEPYRGDYYDYEKVNPFSQNNTSQAFLSGADLFTAV